MASGADNVVFIGLMSVRAVAAARHRQLRRLYVRSDSSVRGISRIISDVKAGGTPVETLSGEELLKRFGHEVTDVALEAGSRKNLTAEELLQKLEKTTEPWVVALEGVEDPHQLGAAFRTAAAVGVNAVIMPGGMGELSPDLVARASAGTSETVTICVADPLGEGLRKLAGAGFKIIATCPEGGKDIFDVSLKDKIALVIGGRLRGLSAETLGACAERIKLPMEGDVPSLTVASSAGAILYEAYRQRHGKSHAS